jgi:hypothetical protein
LAAAHSGTSDGEESSQVKDGLPGPLTSSGEIRPVELQQCKNRKAKGWWLVVGIPFWTWLGTEFAWKGGK